MQHQLAAEARTCFYNRSTPIFDPVVKANDPSARFYVQAINHPDALAEQMADEYLVKNAKRIIAISDVHGNGHLLKKLLQRIRFCETDRLVLLGDHI